VVGPDAVREEALAATDREGPPVWLHGDLHPANIVAVDGTASGVVDFGDMRADDPLRGQREVSRPDLTEGDR
jgi:aminoglycoside phosphotransferase (APT) family kinase protein